MIAMENGQFLQFFPQPFSPQKLCTLLKGSTVFLVCDLELQCPRGAQRLMIPWCHYQLDTFFARCDLVHSLNLRPANITYLFLLAFHLPLS